MGGGPDCQHARGSASVSNTSQTRVRRAWAGRGTEPTLLNPPVPRPCKAEGCTPRLVIVEIQAVPSSVAAVTAVRGVSSVTEHPGGGGGGEAAQPGLGRQQPKETGAAVAVYMRVTIAGIGTARARTCL